MLLDSSQQPVTGLSKQCNGMQKHNKRQKDPLMQTQSVLKRALVRARTLESRVQHSTAEHTTAADPQPTYLVDQLYINPLFIHNGLCEV